MATSYPGALDTLTNPQPTDKLNSSTVRHTDQHTNANDAIEAIEATLGVNPQGGSPTVVARIASYELTLSNHVGNVSNPHSTTAAQTGALAIANNLSDLADAPTARTNLGLGTAAVQNVGYFVLASVVGAANGIATLDGSGLVPTSQIPPIAITETFVVASQTAMLALTAQRGDIAIRTDISKTFILATDSPGTLADWKEILAPTTAGVTSFNGRSGVVVPTAGDYTAAQVGALGVNANNWTGPGSGGMIINCPDTSFGSLIIFSANATAVAAVNCSTKQFEIYQNGLKVYGVDPGAPNPGETRAGGGFFRNYGDAYIGGHCYITGSISATNLRGGFKNKIIDGNFDIWLEGTSSSIVGYGAATMWLGFQTGTTQTRSQQAFALGQTAVPYEPTYFHRSVVVSSAGVGNNAATRTVIESVRTLAGQTATLTFWAKADATKNMAVEVFQNFGGGGSPSADVSVQVTTIALTTSWTKYTIVLNVPSIAGKTIGTNGTDALYVYFWFDAGSAYNARTNSLGQQSGTFDIAQVQLEAGSVATPFEVLTVGETMQRVGRYFEIWRNDSGSSENVLLTYGVGGGNAIASTYTFSVVKRVPPSIAISATFTNFSSAFTVSTKSGFTYQGATASAALAQANVAAGATWMIADARL